MKDIVGKVIRMVAAESAKPHFPSNSTPSKPRKNSSNNDFEKDDMKNENKDQNNKLTTENENPSTKPENLHEELKHAQVYIPAPT